MAKEWILNSAMNRFQLNFKRNVGAVMESIRKCEPNNIKEWEKYYFSNVRDKKHIQELGKRLYIKITEVISTEVDEITEKDCIDYMYNLVINRTYDGYTTEIKTIHNKLVNDLKIDIKPAPDKWDRIYNVDFFIKIKNKYLGLQIKPISNVYSIPEIYKEKSLQKKSHIKFKSEFGGNVFYVFSKKVNGKKEIANLEVIDEIKKEIERLNKL